MRTAVVSDIHGNLTALEAVIADLRLVSPDVVIQAGDLATHGSRPAEVIDYVRERNWSGVYGNTDEMLWMPELADTLRAASPKLMPLYTVLFNELAPATRERIGSERLTWVRQLPRMLSSEDLTVLHATVGNLWRAPMADATDDEIEQVYTGLGRFVAYGHIHRPFVRTLPTGMVVGNCGSVGLSFDGDRRASYLLIDDVHATIRRVAYDVDREIRELARTRSPRASWIAGILLTARYSSPE